MNRKSLIIATIAVFIFNMTSVFAQTSDYYSEPSLSYKKAIELFSQKAYGPAGKLFEKLIDEYGDKKENLFVEDALFFKFVCAVNTKEGDALQQGERFVKRYPQSVHLPSVYFYMGKLYFDRRKYRQTLQVYGKVDPGKLSYDERAEYYYIKGYCYLKTNKPGKALSYFKRVMNTDSPYALPAKYYYAHVQYLRKNFDEALKIFEQLKDNRKFKRYIPEYLVHIYYEKKQYDKVISEGENYIKNASSKTKGEIAGLIANSYYELKDYDKALEYYNIYERYSRNIPPEDNYKIGVVKYKAGLYRDAIGNFEKATALENEIGQTAWYYLGFCYLNTGQDKFSRDAFLKAYRMGGNREISDDALINYIKTTVKTGGDPYNDEIAILEDFIKNHKSSPRINEAYDLLAKLFISSKDYNKALKSLEKISALSPQLKKVYQQLAYNKALELYKRSDFEEAGKLFTKALKYSANPQIYTLSLYWKGDVLYRLGKYKEAEVWYKKFLKRKNAVHTKYYPVAFYNLGYIAYHQKKYNDAINYFLKFVKMSKDDKLTKDALLRIADSYFITKNFDKAIVYYDKVIKKGGGNVDYALYQKASCYGAKGNFKEKISTLNTLVRNYGNSNLYSSALFEIGSTYLVIDDRRHAISSFNRIVRKKPNSSFAKKALMKTGLLYYGNNQYDKAIKTFKEIIKKYPASPEATEALNSLKNIYTDMGKVDEYIAFARKLNFVQVSKSEEDSLTFVAGENMFLDNKCANSIQALKKYITKFPKGGFVLKSYYYIARCYENLKTPDSALVYYNKILDFPDNQYTLKALLTSARLDFDKKNFEESYDYYSKLLDLAETNKLKLEALDGMMRSAFYSGKYKKASNAAKELLKTDNVDEGEIVFAHYVLGKTYYANNDLKEAEREFGITDKLTSGEKGAEAKYYIAEIEFKNKNLDAAEKTVYELSDNYPDFTYWVAKGFILLSDVYLERSNSFQAEQTLKSIIDNYEGNDLKKIAQEKLDKIKSQKLKNNENENGNE